MKLKSETLQSFWKEIISLSCYYLQFHNLHHIGADPGWVQLNPRKSKGKRKEKSAKNQNRKTAYTFPTPHCITILIFGVVVCWVANLHRLFFEHGFDSHERLFVFFIHVFFVCFPSFFCFDGNVLSLDNGLLFNSLLFISFYTIPLLFFPFWTRQLYFLALFLVVSIFIEYFHFFFRKVNPK